MRMETLNDGAMAPVNFTDRIGYDAGATRPEEALAGEHRLRRRRGLRAS